jgi:Tfp pilus assembly ATPase PilU
MQTMNQALLSLYERHLIALDDALEHSHNLDELRQMMANAGILDRKKPGKAA